MSKITLPKLAKGEVYAGVTVHEERPMRLILLTGDAGGLNWEDAKEWAATQGGDLPSRFDQLVLFKNLKGEFKPDHYWSAEAYAGDASCAWYQYFYDSYQYYDPQANELRARAIRRIDIGGGAK